MNAYALDSFPSSHEELLSQAGWKSYRTLKGKLHRAWGFIRKPHIEERHTCLDVGRIAEIARGATAKLSEWDHLNICKLGCDAYRQKLVEKFKKEAYRDGLQTQIGIVDPVDISEARLVLPLSSNS